MHVSNIAAPVVGDLALADFGIFRPVQGEAAIVVLIAHLPAQQRATFAEVVMLPPKCVPQHDAVSVNVGPLDTQWNFDVVLAKHPD